MRHSIVGGMLGTVLGVTALAACGGSGANPQNDVDALVLQVQQLTQDLADLKARYDADEADEGAHHPATGRLALHYCIAMEGTYPRRALTEAVVGGGPDTEVSDSPMLGSVALFAGTFAPRGWAFCDGQLLDIANYEDLFSVVGATYGGDGRVKFALPDLRGRAAVGVSSALPLGSAAD